MTKYKMVCSYRGSISMEDAFGEGGQWQQSGWGIDGSEVCIE